MAMSYADFVMRDLMTHIDRERVLGDRLMVGYQTYEEFEEAVRVAREAELAAEIALDSTR